MMVLAQAVTAIGLQHSVFQLCSYVVTLLHVIPLKITSGLETHNANVVSANKFGSVSCVIQATLSDSIAGFPTAEEAQIGQKQD